MDETMTTHSDTSRVAPPRAVHVPQAFTLGHGALNHTPYSIVKMLTNLKSTKDKRANLETQLSVSLGKVALLEKGHATLEGQLAAATAASTANETVALTAAEREAASKDQ
ncbi:hypothetical protein Q3G72_004414 [Acer saccharum]|nr:hypothetical protein Q3G72_004414 [Acer saccharum]